MFGKKKAADNAESAPDEKPVAKAPKSKSKGSFDAKEFMLLHAEKFVFALIALLSAGLIYLGATTKSFDSKKDPARLSSEASQVMTQIRENHWDAIKNEDARVKGIIDVSYTEKSIESTKAVPPDLYRPEIPKPGSRVTGYRVDPNILAPVQLEGHYHFGPIVVGNANASLVDYLDKLPDAKVKEEKEKKDSKQGGRGSMPPGYGGQEGGGPPGMGGGAPSPPKDAKRFLATGYDRGFPSHTLNLNPPPDKDGKKKVIGPRDIGFVSVVGLAPHQDMEKEYRTKLSPGGGIMPGRDTPNYIGFEVERADVTDDPSKDPTADDWKPLPNASSEKITQLSKNVWLGSNQEVLAKEWTTPTLTMPVPPLLLKDYRDVVTHKEIPTTGQMTVSAMPSGGAGLGGGSSFGSSESESTESESGSSGFGAAGAGSAPPGYGGGGAPPGYNGGASGGGAPPGYGGGGAPPGYNGGASGGGAPPGYGGGAGSSGAPPGYGGGSGMPGSGGAAGGIIVPPAEAPKELPSTKYKAVRFYDFEAKPNRIYRYRVRLLMYDPNFPEAAGIQPRSSLLDVASGTLKRVQDLAEKERKDIEASKAAAEAKDKDKKDATVTAYRRTSSRKTEWSAPTPPVVTKRVADAYLGDTNLSYSVDREKRIFESNPPRAEMVVADYDSKMAVAIPRKDSASRGYVFGLPNRDGGKEVPLEIIHPITKIIKNLEKRESKSLCTVIDIHGMIPLEMKIAKDAHLKSGGEALAFDPESGRIVVMREFDDFTGFGMNTQPDKTAVGPLGGPMKVEAAVAMGGSGGGAGAPGFGGASAGGGSKPSFGGSGGGGGGGNNGAGSSSSTD